MCDALEHRVFYRYMERWPMPIGVPMLCLLSKSFEHYVYQAITSSRLGMHDCCSHLQPTQNHNAIIIELADCGTDMFWPTWRVASSQR